MASPSVRHWDASGTTQILNPVDWGTIYSGVAVTARKFFVENTSDRALVSVIAPIENVSTGNDAASFLVVGADTATVVPPYNFSYVLGSTGGGGVWGSTGIVFYVITATNGSGETQISVELSVTVDDTTKKVTLTWSQPTGATGYKIYRSTTSGTYTTPALLTTIGSGATLSFIDDGSAVSAGAAPTENTTGGAGPAYGTPPALTNATLVVGNLALQQQFVYWVDWVPVGSPPSTLNPRQGRFHFQES